MMNSFYPSFAIIKQMEKKYAILEKEVGETPLALLERFRAANPRVGDKKLTYAGRLDPMASGKIIALVGEECKNKEKYLALDKEYEFEVLFGFASDTGDVLGLAEGGAAVGAISAAALRDAGGKLIGAASLPYPAFSSKTVRGKPLFAWALEGRLGEIEIPRRKSVIYEISFEGARTLPKERLRAEIFGKIAKFSPEPDGKRKGSPGADFRKKEILERWGAVLDGASGKEFQVVKFACAVSSGTYVRTLAEEIGKAFSAKALALSIHRTKIGDFSGARESF